MLLIVEPGTPPATPPSSRCGSNWLPLARMSPRPARMSAPVRWPRPTGAISPSACRARARTGRSRPPSSPRGREIRLCGAEPRGGRTASCPRAGAARYRQGGSDREALHASRSSHDKGAAPGQTDYARARRWRWGDAVMEEGLTSSVRERPPEPDPPCLGDRHARASGHPRLCPTKHERRGWPDKPGHDEKNKSISICERDVANAGRFSVIL